MKQANLVARAVPVLMYHEVLDTVERSHATRALVPHYCVSDSQFAQQMAAVARTVSETLTIAELVDHRQRSSSRAVAVTFDDGLVGNYRFAFPALLRYGIKATVFAVVSRIGTERYLDWSQLREMHAAGVLVGSHTMHHYPLQTQSAATIAQELIDSRRILEDGLGAAIEHLSLPHGSMDRRVIESAAAAGYVSVCTSEVGVGTWGGRPVMVRRLPVADKWRPSMFQRIIEADPRVVRRLALKKRMRNAVKRVIGVNNYRRIYRMVFRIGTPQDRATG